MTSVQGRRRLRRERSFATPSIAPLDFSPLPESGDELSDQPAGPSGTKPPVANAPATTSIPKYFEDDLQEILKAVLEARDPVPAPAPISAPVPVLAPASILAPASVFTSASIVAEAP